MIIPGILQENIEDIRKDLETIKDFAHLVQIDFADGELVEGKTFLDLNKILEIDTPTKYDIHLMVKDPFPFLEVSSTKIKQISAQAEAPVDLEKWLNTAREKGYKAGLSLAPTTSWKRIEHLIPSVDFIQFLTVTPGKQAGPFQPQVLQTIREFHQKYLEIPIQVDGGIKETNIKLVLNAGVNNVVIGSAIMRAKNPMEAYKNFERILKEHGKTT